MWSAGGSAQSATPVDVSSRSPGSVLRDAVASLAYSPDGRWIASGSLDGTIGVWDSETGKSLGEQLPGHSGVIYSLAFSPEEETDDNRFLFASREATIRVWDSTTLQAVDEPLRGHKSTVWDAKYSPNGRQIISGSADSTIRVWDIKTHESLERHFDGIARGVRCVAWEPDSMLVAASLDDQIGHAWGRCIRRTVAVCAVSRSADGRYVMSSHDRQGASSPAVKRTRKFGTVLT